MLLVKRGSELSNAIKPSQFIFSVGVFSIKSFSNVAKLLMNHLPQSINAREHFGRGHAKQQKRGT